MPDPSATPLFPARVLAGALLLALPLAQPAGAQTIADTSKSVNAHGDHGYWQPGQPDVMILWPQDQQNIVKRFTGNKEHPYPYRLWVDPDRAGGFPVLLKDKASFNNFLEHIKANADKRWCQLAETWGSWQGRAPGACGVHHYTQTRACAIDPAATRPCPDLCQPAVQSRRRQVDNGACGKPTTPKTPPTSPLTTTTTPTTPPSTTTPATPPARQQCATGPWTPATSRICAGRRFTQTRTRADCSSQSRRAVGSKSCTQTCRVSAWTPAANTVCRGKTFTQTRRLGDCSGAGRTAIGSKYCPPSCTATPWAPAPGTVCSNRSFTQTRTRQNCGTERRSVRGSKCCGKVTAWSPDPAGRCGSFTQTRANGCGKSESRPAKGTASWCGCTWGPYQPPVDMVCSGMRFTQRSHSTCNGKVTNSRARNAVGTRYCPSQCSRGGFRNHQTYGRQICINGIWEFP